MRVRQTAETAAVAVPAGVLPKERTAGKGLPGKDCRERTARCRRNKKLLQVYISNEQDRAIQVLAGARGYTVSGFVRAALNSFTDQLLEEETRRNSRLALLEAVPNQED